MLQMKIHQIKTSETGTIVSIYHKTSGIDKAAIDEPKRPGAVRVENALAEWLVSSRVQGLAKNTVVAGHYLVLSAQN